MTEPASITCPQCGAVSYAERDITEGYCGACNDWTGAVKELVGRLPFDEMHPPMHWDRQGHPISFARWVWLYEHKFETGYGRIADDYVGPFRVSTIWEGLASPSLTPVPLIFETAIFTNGEWIDRERWATEEAARAGHERTLAEVKANIIREADK